MAAVAAAHGIGGEVRLKLFGEGAGALKRYRAFIVSGTGAVLTVKSLKDDGKGGAIARFVEVADRTAAEKLRGSALCVPRSEMPALGAGEYYHADLIGLAAVCTDGTALGRVVAVENFGAGDILEIEKPAESDGKPGKRFMVPMRAEAVPEWDAARLLVDAAYAE
ncbi:MAG: 16S rRNA processing protein RimM [Sphingomonadales bacterium]|nr:16S rRNA processing protein RimM [Sphingomonadales bacterium]